MPQVFSTLFNVLLMIIGFGLVIVVHEFGHFAAARWAGVRVHTFAVGFGSAIATWRKGLGFRWGSSEKEYFRIAREEPEAAGRISPTEYRLNWFPFGGYVKMLGQEDLAPIPSMTAADSFAAKPVWKRMVIMSGGVFMNLVLAGVLFVAAYMHGIDEVAPIVGEVAPGSSAEKAGLKPGDRVRAIDGSQATTFNDIRLAAAMGHPNEPLRFSVERAGEPSPVSIDIAPALGPGGTLQIGVGPAASTALLSEHDLVGAGLRDEYLRRLQEVGLGAMQPGMRLTRIGGAAVRAEGNDPWSTPTAQPLREALEAARGEPVTVEFADDSGRSAEATLRAEPALQTAKQTIGETAIEVRHLLGLVPAMRVVATQERGERAGLLAGDVFARIGDVEWPSVAAGIAEVREHKGKDIALVVMRDGAMISLSAPVSREGFIGFVPGDTSMSDTLVGVSSGLAAGTGAMQSPGAASGLVPGSRIVAVDGVEVKNFGDLRRALMGSADEAKGGAVTLDVVLPFKDAAGAAAREQMTVEVSAEGAAALGGLGWNADQVLFVFDFAKFVDRAETPAQAISKGVAKTHYVVMMTYLTFLRLFQGTVPVDQLHGPVGITHLGSRVAEQGFIYLVFFLGLISANLAVINFLPLPIVDGGHMVFLAIEGITRRPVSAAVQNLSIIAGLLIVGTVFLVVTYNDLVRLFG